MEVLLLTAQSSYSCNNANARAPPEGEPLRKTRKEKGGRGEVGTGEGGRHKYSERSDSWRLAKRSLSYVPTENTQDSTYRGGLYGALQVP